MLQIEDPDFYEWETHIFFDDAMEPNDEGNEFQVNQFVRLLVAQVEEAGENEHSTRLQDAEKRLLKSAKIGMKWYGRRGMKVPPPAKYATPYGGRLVWNLPGQTKIICHLKDKNKIRHKKRWSQCMYMYYFLGHQLADKPDLTSEQKDLR